MAAWASMTDDEYDVCESHGRDVRVTDDYAEWDGELGREDWPIHQPGPAYEAPIPGLHWYGGCEPGYPRVNPATGVCEGCGEQACRECGRENCPDHDAEAVAVAGLREAIAEIDAILERAAAA